MSDTTRYIPPEEREVLDELPNVSTRGAPKVWEYRLREIIDRPGWHPLAEGPKTAMFAMKSNFKYGRMSKPDGHEFECEVVPYTEPERDNLAQIYFRYLGPTKVLTPEEIQEAARLKLEKMLVDLEKEVPPDDQHHDVAPEVERQVDDPGDHPLPDGLDDLGDDLDDGVSEVHEVDLVPPLSPEQLAEIQSRMIPVEDTNTDLVDSRFDSGLDEL